MVNVSIDQNLYSDIKKYVKSNKLRYPSIKFFVQKAAISMLQGEKEVNDEHAKYK